MTPLFENRPGDWFRLWALPIKAKPIKWNPIFTLQLNFISSGIRKDVCIYQKRFASKNIHYMKMQLKQLEKNDLAFRKLTLSSLE